MTSAALRRQQFTRISGHAGRASADFVCITDFFDLHDQINLILSDACRVMRIRQQLLRQHHDLLRAVGIHHRVAQNRNRLCQYNR